MLERAIAYLIAIQNARRISAFAELDTASALTRSQGAAKHGEMIMKAKPNNPRDEMHALRKRLRTTGNDTRRSETTIDPAAVRALDLTPGFRDRLIESLNEVGVPARGRMAYVASLTDRAVQTVSRWLDPREPGLPDLESCARLCDGLGRNSVRIPDQKRQGFRFKPATISDAIPPPRWPAEGLGRASAAEAPENPAR